MSTPSTSVEQPPWPRLPVGDWEPTRDTLTLWLQVVGKIRIARSPLLNHWWNAPLYLTGRGLTTSLMPGDPGRSFSIDLDLVEHRLDVVTTTDQTRSIDLVPMTVRDFHAEVMGQLASLGLETEIWPVPVEIPDAVAFTEDEVHDSYDAASVTAFWRTLVQTERVLQVFRARFLGKSSPVHLFWGALDLATTRFSGRTAPPHPGGDGEGLFYSYAYPEPPGFRDRPSGPTGSRFDDALGEFVLPYAAVRTAEDPDAVLLDFLQATYEAAADTAGWDRSALERRGGTR